MKNKIIIGRSDIGDFPTLGLENIALKVDTGAYTSAIHCTNIQLDSHEGKQILSFVLLDPSHQNYNNKVFKTEHFKEKHIKNSFGLSEKRYIITTKIYLFDKTFPIQLSLSKRGEMRFPILLGRKFLKGKFIVDSSKKNISFDQNNQTKQQNH